jgi:hypothetical protein
MNPINDSHQSNTQIYRLFLDRLRAVRGGKAPAESGKAQNARGTGKKGSAEIIRQEESDRETGTVRAPAPGIAQGESVNPGKGTTVVLGQVVRQVNQLIRELDEDGDRKLTAAELSGKPVTFSPRGGGPDITVPLTTGAEPAQIVATSATGTGTLTILLKGNLGQIHLTYASGSPADAIAASINGESQSTGVVATASGAALILNSHESGSDAFVSVTPIVGDLHLEGGATVRQGHTVLDQGEDGSIIGDLDRNGDAELDRRELIRAYLDAIENTPSNSLSFRV